MSSGSRGKNESDQGAEKLQGEFQSDQGIHSKCTISAKLMFIDIVTLITSGADAALKMIGSKSIIVIGGLETF